MADEQDWRAQPLGGSGASSGSDFLSSFGGPPPPASLPVPARPPWPWAAASLVLGLTGLLLAVLAGGAVSLAAVAWLLGGPLAVTLAALYLRRDTLRRAQPLRVDYAWARVLYVGALVVALAAVVAASVRLAFWFGRHPPWG